MDLKMMAGLAGAVVFTIVVIAFYNRLVRSRYATQRSWSDIDVHLKKRYELLPNLVETVKAYAAHESATLTQVIEKRALAMRAVTPGEKAMAESMLSKTLQGLLAIAEASPALKADSHFRQLMTQMRELEDNIEYARRYYNAAVRDYNIVTEVFPSTIIASAFSFA
ncbi:MAG: LemA family protein, partial [Vicinamibacteria bacterium]